MARTGTGRRTTPAPHAIDQVPDSKHPRSTFDRSHGVKLTLDSGFLVPVLVEEILPGDTLQCVMYNFARLATIIRPVLDNLRLTAFFFFTPNRIVWDNWTAFMGSKENDDVTVYTVPTITKGAPGWPTGSTADYYGIPIDIPDVAVNALPFRCGNLIWNTWFRDQNLQQSIVVDTDNGPDLPADYVDLQRRGRRHDYITSCLPFLQKGPPITLPLGTTAPVVSDTLSGGAGYPRLSGAGASGTYLEGSLLNNIDSSLILSTTANMSWHTSGLVADLSLASAATINELRMSNALQVLYERDARAGTRYPEMLQSQFGVTLPDAQWRPEYLGGGSQSITISPVPQTSMTGDSGGTDTYLGEIAGYGTTMGAQSFVKSFAEHGWVHGYVSIQSDISYQQALDKKWQRLTREDFYTPALANLGEQEVLNSEVMLQDPNTSGSDNTDVFGYQERWAEYKYGSLSGIRGKFRSAASGTLEMYHYGLDFETLPVLGPDFIEDDPPLDRIVAVNTEPELLLDIFFKMKHTRVMPTYSVPSLMTRF